MENRLVSLFQKALLEGWENPIFSDYEGETFNGREVAAKVQSLHQLYESLEIQKGQKIALLGRNSSNWTTTYISIITYGAVVVPILPDFSKEEVFNILEHSESVLLIVGNKHFAQLKEVSIANFKGVYSLNDFSLLQGDENKKYIPTENISAEQIAYTPISEKDLAVLSYTSGTSGFSKGVMLTTQNLWSNVQFALDNMPLKRGDKMVSILPLAHAFGCAFEFLWPFCAGVHVYFIEKIPSPTLLVKAYQEVKPKLILLVPLIFEKIYRKNIKPTLDTFKVKVLLNIPIVNRLVYRKIGKKLFDFFGGEFREIVIGGAALNPEVEAFFKRIKFPFTVGYGMTECAPLISYIASRNFKNQSCGRVVDRMEIKISKEQENGVGEILVRGENTMLGYYKKPEETKAVLNEDGWLRTGDLGEVDEQGLLYIRGRSKNMILGPSGQNIYPEEIEAHLNNYPMIVESIVVGDKEHRIVALVFLDADYCQKHGWTDEQIAKKLEEERKEINKTLPAYKQIFRIELVDEEFEKTPKQSIKRYLYSDYKEK